MRALALAEIACSASVWLVGRVSDRASAHRLASSETCIASQTHASQALCLPRTGRECSSESYGSGGRKDPLWLAARKRPRIRPPKPIKTRFIAYSETDD